MMTSSMHKLNEQPMYTIFHKLQAKLYVQLLTCIHYGLICPLQQQATQWVHDVCLFVVNAKE